MIKQTFQPHKIRRKRTHGFLVRSKKVLARRRKKGRRSLTV